MLGFIQTYIKKHNAIYEGWAYNQCLFSLLITVLKVKQGLEKQEPQTKFLHNSSLYSFYCQQQFSG